MYIFCDVDSTIINKDIIYDSTREAIRLLKQNGHKVFIASGRSKVEIYPNILSMGFDGFVLSNGCYIEFENEIKYIEYMDKNIVQRVCDYCDNHGFGYVVDTKDSLIGQELFLEDYASGMQNETKETVRRLFMALVVGEARRSDVTKINVIVKNEDDVIKLRQEACQGLSFREYHYTEKNSFIEIENLGNSKGKGIEKLCQIMNVSMDDTIAIGDEINDLEMIKMCHIGICMGNGNDIVKKEADLITDDIDKDGFYKAFKELNMI